MRIVMEERIGQQLRVLDQTLQSSREVEEFIRRLRKCAEALWPKQPKTKIEIKL